MIKKFKEAIHERETLIELIINAKKDDPETGSFTEHLVDYLIANGVTVQEGKPLEAFLHPVVAHEGLKAKYLVFGAASGKEIKNCFVLRPDKDPAAVEALRAYARTTDNETLAEDIYNWVGKGKPVREWISASEPPEEHDSIWAKLYGTKSWQPGLFRKCSYDVLACVEKKDGSRRVISIRTYDGKWDNNKLNEETVICWQSMPQPPKGE